MCSKIRKTISDPFILPELMKPDDFEATAKKLEELEGKELHYAAAFAAAEAEGNIDDFEDKYNSLISQPYRRAHNSGIILKQCQDQCREHFQRRRELEKVIRKRKI